MKIKKIHDQHVHTSYSEDSSASLEKYIQIAIDLGCSYFVMTDHLDFDIPMYHKHWIADYDKQKKEIIELQKKYKNKITLLQGIECGYREGYENNINLIGISYGFYHLLTLVLSYLFLMFCFSLLIFLIKLLADFQIN